MNIIEQATKRLEQLERAGIEVPWAAAGLPGDRVAAGAAVAEAQATAAAAIESIEAKSHGAGAAPALQLVTPATSAEAKAEPVIAPPAPAVSLAPRTSVELDLRALGHAGYLVPDQVRSEMAEQFRHVKRPLLKNVRAMSANLAQRGAMIMVTSALPGEGKTFCSINLAMSMAMEVDTSVVLVDADVVRPSLFKRLGIESTSPGLLDLLTRDDIELEDALVSTNVPKLSLMASGDRSGRSTELLASTAMDKLLIRLANEHRDYVVIFDAPPVLLTTESSVLASKVGQVVMIVEASKTGRSAVQQAFAALSHCPVVLSVLNKGNEPTEGRRYGYYYQ